MKAKPLNVFITLENYKFTLYSLDGFRFNQKIEIDSISENDKGLYYFGKRYSKNGKFCHKCLYLGKSDNLYQRPLTSSHEKWDKLKENECNCIGIYKCKCNENPKDIESQILAKHKFTLNIQENA